ncbi:MAG: phenylacetate-CoA oxygenase subunit PaaC [Gammaproteobacteria bacterium]|nr:phenylacetate-CoA oxygenase subunit PaaC [Gammaproteobacteria bacterium]
MSRAEPERSYPELGQTERFRYVLRLADTCLILGQRLGEWVGHAPALEEDLGVANVSLDLIGQARMLLSYAGEIEAAGRDEDRLAYLRDQNDFFNLALVEQPNGDFGCTIVRQVLIDAWQLELHTWLEASTDQRLREIAAKAVKETRYHLRYSSGWLIRLGDGTDESHRRVQASLDDLWKFTNEFFTPDEIDVLAENAGVAPPLSELRTAWSYRIDEILNQATLTRPVDVSYGWFGKRGEHTEHLGYILSDLQFLQRTYPDATW